MYITYPDSTGAELVGGVDGAGNIAREHGSGEAVSSIIRKLDDI